MLKKCKFHLVIAFLCALLAAPLGAFAEEVKEVKVSPNPAPGVKYYTIERENIDGNPIKGAVLEVNPKEPLMEIRPALGRDRLSGTETLSSIAQRHGAVAAINGGYYGGDGHPIGSFVVDGRAITASDMLRTSWGISKSGNVQMGYISPVTAVHLPGLSERVLVDRLNRWPVENGVGVYTHHWGSQTPQAVAGVVEIVVNEQGTVEQINSGIGYSRIPAGGYVIALWGDKGGLASGLNTGDSVRLGQYFGEQWANLNHLITAGPLLVEKGIPVFNAVNEGFTGNLLLDNPRTALGVKANGNLLLVTIDGRQPEHSAGVTLEELAYIMVELGAVQAVNLDGGGSTQMWVQGQTVNKPSGGVERPLGNAILVLHQIPVYLDKQRLWFDVPPVLREGRTMVPLRRIFESLGAQVEYEQGVVTAQKDGTAVVLKINERQAKIDEKIVMLDVPAAVVDGRTMVPLRFVSEAMGAKVEWDGSAKTVFIETQRGDK
ncbi:phosphodiester glycosidase family protein [Desulfofalx alkaliphila]|uniref:phosphodiester glycosidase family protein n=1 Tax=Desulfofalx alkaliphila TaxID=105483 RepID=UPI0004E0CCE2|nr:phosphodiester glycosidase family protein [Desulfofalx alkaliphila]